MKYRCACGKPDYLSFSGNDMLQLPQIKLCPPYDTEMLHFKAADRECERCGRPLCKDCGIQKIVMRDIKQEGLHYTWFIAKSATLCPICSEVI